MAGARSTGSSRWSLLTGWADSLGATAEVTTWSVSPPRSSMSVAGLGWALSRGWTTKQYEGKRFRCPGTDDSALFSPGVGASAGGTSSRQTACRFLKKRTRIEYRLLSFVGMGC